jgi:hypothetical protein
MTNYAYFTNVTFNLVGFAQQKNIFLFFYYGCTFTDCTTVNGNIINYGSDWITITNVENVIGYIYSHNSTSYIDFSGTTEVYSPTNLPCYVK